MFMHSLAKAVIVLLAAAPGQAPASVADVPDLAKAAIQRRLAGELAAFEISALKPSDRMPGFVACGTVRERTASGAATGPERFFAVVPGNFAVLDRDGRSLVELYWRLNHC